MIKIFILSVFLDVHSSCLVLNNGGREILLPFKSCRSQIISQSLGAGLVTVWTSTRKKKHPKLTRTILILGTVAHTSAAIYNYRQYKRND